MFCRHAGVFNEPLADLMKVLASLVDSSNRILVPGFQALVRPNTLEPALERLAASSEFSLDGYRAALGIPCLVRPSPPVPSPFRGCRYHCAAVLVSLRVAAASRLPSEGSHLRTEPFMESLHARQHDAIKRLAGFFCSAFQ